MTNDPICSVAGCQRQKLARGWCKAHLSRWRRYGTPLAGRAMNGEQPNYYAEVVLRHEGPDCLIWPYSRSKDGYAYMHRNGRKVRVQRAVCEDVYGPAPFLGAEAAHSCGKGSLACVSKRHLRWATHADNIADKAAHGTNARGSDVWAAKLCSNDILSIRSLIADGKSLSSIARQFKVARSTIQAIDTGKTWSWVRPDPVKDIHLSRRAIVHRRLADELGRAS